MSLDREKFILDPAANVQRWEKCRNRDVQAPDPLPMSPRIQQLRAQIAAGTYLTDEKYAVAEERFVATHFTDLAAVNDAEEGEEQEDADRLIVLPKRGDDMGQDDQVEHEERFDGME